MILTVSPIAADDVALRKTVPGRLLVVPGPRDSLTAPMRSRLRGVAVIATGRWAACIW